MPPETAHLMPSTFTPNPEETTSMDLFTAPMMSRHFSPNLGAELTLVARRWDQPGITDPRNLPADHVALSSDGRRWIDGWHTGPESAEAVYVESHIRGGASFHGWVDAVSRRVVQAG